MARESCDVLIEKVDQLLRVLAAMATRDMKQRDKISLLDKAGLQPKDIASLLGTSSNTVRVELVALRKVSRGISRRRRHGER